MVQRVMVTAEWLEFRTVQRWGLFYIRRFRTGLSVGAPALDDAIEIFFKVKVLCSGCSDSLECVERERTTRHVAQVWRRVAPGFFVADRFALGADAGLERCAVHASGQWVGAHSAWS